jgi:hypothetical protein
MNKSKRISTTVTTRAKNSLKKRRNEEKERKRYSKFPNNKLKLNRFLKRRENTSIRNINRIHSR